jgi:hypothetical protein
VAGAKLSRALTNRGASFPAQFDAIITDGSAATGVTRHHLEFAPSLWPVGNSQGARVDRAATAARPRRQGDRVRRVSAFETIRAANVRCSERFNSLRPNMVASSMKLEALLSTPVGPLHDRRGVAFGGGYFSPSSRPSVSAHDRKPFAAIRC